ncbi:copper-binding protein [Comamonas thiooxydans]|uniref:copper-binding protein n=1 Tax=Comamonas thiooxydans TaxID=363952 RepID=UPI00050E91DE|nr:copper-binding protein [Comamonas thiooxydans]KGH21597.1 signal peptide protein [Comamonas thiooxydans]
MKLVSTATLIAALSFSAATFAQSGDMGNMKMEGKGMQNCMDMKDMDAKNCQNMMKGMDAKGTAKATKSTAHEADAVVKEFDATQGKVTLAHGPVKSLGWPAMTMAFGVKDKALFDKLAVGTKVHVGFKKEGDEYVVTSVK